MHHRMWPKKHRFHYSVFMFYIDLDEINDLDKKLVLFSRNRFNAFTFKDKEHLQLPKDNPDTSLPVKDHIISFLRQNGYEYSNERVFLLTNMSVWGYNFNPVSFYFIVNQHHEAVCAIAEVNNTFGEQKPYFLGADTLREKTFELQTPKHFYVSPFIGHDNEFAFFLTPPNDKLNIRINTHHPEKGKFFISTLTGKRIPLSDGRLLWFLFRFPFITIKVISLIHWHAFRLWLKQLPYLKKAEQKELQKDVYKQNTNY